MCFRWHTCCYGNNESFEHGGLSAAAQSCGGCDTIAALSQGAHRQARLLGLLPEEVPPQVSRSESKCLSEWFCNAAVAAQEPEPGPRCCAAVRVLLSCSDSCVFPPEEHGLPER